MQMVIFPKKDRCGLEINNTFMIVLIIFALKNYKRKIEITMIVVLEDQQKDRVLQYS